MSLLELQHVSKSYERGLRTLEVLRDVSLAVQPGDFVAIYGKPSAGKTTLLKIAAGLERPDSGCVRVAGRDLGELSPTQLADVHNQQLAWVERTGPQSREWQILDYVSLPVMHGRPAAARQRALDALERVGVLDCESARWDDLGNRERLLVALAHAIVRQPKLLVLDDPTAGLDAVERDRFMSVLRSMADEIGFGVLMGVPDMPSMLRANEMRSLSRGRLLGPPDPPEGQGALIDFPGGVERSA